MCFPCISLILSCTLKCITTLISQFIIGNDILNQLTTYHNQKLKIVLSDFAGITKHADYTTFYVGNELFHYPLRIGGYSGDAGKCIFKFIRMGHTLIT